MKIIDALGKPCPIPVVEAKKALAEPGVTEVLVKVDNRVALQNLEKMARALGCSFSYVTAEDGNYHVTVTGDGTVTASPAPAPVTANNQAEGRPAGSEKIVVVLGQDQMGHGSEELGKILIKGFIYSLTELEVPPAAVIFINSGVRLTCQGSNTIADLKRLEDEGTEIVSCGTCLNYFELTEQLAVGVINDMYGITTLMTSADKVINL